MTRIEEILSFWFGEIDAGGLATTAQAKRWFRASAETDNLILERFETDLQKAIQGQLTSWEQYPRGRLALIVLLDQFSRNIYRGTARAFAQDELALSLCLQGIDIGHDLALRPIERTFYYLPMEHAESLEMQDRCVQHYEQLVASLPPGSGGEASAFAQLCAQPSRCHRPVRPLPPSQQTVATGIDGSRTRVSVPGRGYLRTTVII
ncbi:MAG: DUF924 domain-containing protein [Gammaproteobacteria bacterium]|nr:DUF924 domain-containing protein [Gammaproteobacteria bacterium]